MNFCSAPRKMSTVEDEEEMDEDLSLTFEGKVEVDKNENSFSSKYNTHEELGKGRFGIVFKCTKASDGHKRAAKVVRCIKAKDREQVRNNRTQRLNCLLMRDCVGSRGNRDHELSEALQAVATGGCI